MFLVHSGLVLLVAELGPLHVTDLNNILFYLTNNAYTDSNSQKHRMVFVHVFSGGYWSWRNWERLMYYNYNWHFVETLKEIIPRLLLYEIWGDFDHMELGALDVLYLQLAFC